MHQVSQQSWKICATLVWVVRNTMQVNQPDKPQVHICHRGDPVCTNKWPLYKCPSIVDRYILVILGMFTKWIEVYLCRWCGVTTVAKLLLKEYICKYGIPYKIYTDQGTHFTAVLNKELCKALQIKQYFHFPYHPQSPGEFEHKNGVLKNKIAKICAETGLKWPAAIPVALVAMSHTVNRKVVCHHIRYWQGDQCRSQGQSHSHWNKWIYTWWMKPWSTFAVRN